jgi:Tol biopolymer transport system component
MVRALLVGGACVMATATALSGCGGDAAISDHGDPGSVISFTRYETGGAGHVFTMAPDGSGVQQVTSAPGVQAHSTVSPDGTALAYSQVHPTGSSVEIIDRAGGAPRVLNKGSNWSLVPSWSPDGSRVAFTSDADGNHEIFTMKSDGTDVRQLTFTQPPIQHAGPKYSPDGATLLYASDKDEEDPTSQQDLWVMPSGGGVGTRLTTDINNRESRSWSPDGSRIVTQTISDGVGQLIVLDSDGAGQRQITRVPQSTPTFAPGGIFPVMRGAVTPAWSPDGEWISFASNHQGNYDIYLIRPDGSGMTRITDSPRHELSVGWGPIARIRASSSRTPG